MKYKELEQELESLETRTTDELEDLSSKNNQEPNSQDLKAILTKSLNEDSSFKAAKRNQRLMNRYLNSIDIKYLGPLSYRHLRLLAWICIALSQIVMINEIDLLAFDHGYLNPIVSLILSIFSNLSTPFFLLASFGTILNRTKPYRDTILVYGLGFFGIGLAFLVVYMRYGYDLLGLFEIDVAYTSMALGKKFGSRLLVNIFTDLFLLTLFNYFLHYTPKNHFLGKKIVFFRLFALLPLSYLIVADTLQVLTKLQMVVLPIEIFLFLTSKSYMMHIIFIILSLWVKKRESTFLRLGATKDEFLQYQTTNRCSWSFAKATAILFAVFGFLDFFITAVVINIASLDPAYTLLSIYDLIENLGLGQTLGMLVACPFILLFSITRTHKDKMIDLLVPVIGIGVVVLVTIESVFVSLRMLRNKGTETPSEGNLVSHLLMKAFQRFNK